MNEHSASDARAQALSPLDGALLALLAAATAVTSLTGRRDALYACVAAAAVWIVARLAIRPATAAAAPEPRMRPATPATPAGARLRWALEATPVGYRIGLAGLGVAMVGLVGDAAWHAGAGGEEGLARVIAPFHVLLFAGAGLLLLSPIRAMWASPDHTGPLTLRQAAPLVGALTLVTALALFVFQWLSAFGDWQTPPVSTDPAVAQDIERLLVAGIVASNLLLLGPALVAARRFRLPFGSLAVMFTVAAAMAAALRDLTLVGTVLAALAAGLTADVLARRATTDDGPAPWRVLAALTSIVFAGVALTALAVLHDRTLPLDLELGTIVLTGLTGLALSVIAVPPAGPAIAPVEAAVEAEAAPAPARRRPRDPAALRLAGRVAGSAAVREVPVAATALCELLQGHAPKDVRVAFAPPLSPAELEELCADVVRRHGEWATHRLEDTDIVYLFLEAVPFAPGRGDLLAAWGVTRRGRRDLLGVRLGAAADPDDWDALAVDLVARGLRPPAAIVTDGAAGVWRVLGDLWPSVAVQLCVRHALAEACADLPPAEAKNLRTRVDAVLEAAHGPAEARAALGAVVEHVAQSAPRAMAVLARRLERLTPHLAFPSEHRRALRSSTLLQRSLAEPALADRPLAALPGGASPLVLGWAVLELGTHGVRRLSMPLHAVAQLDQLRRREALVPKETS